MLLHVSGELLILLTYMLSIKNHEVVLNNQFAY